MKKLIYVLALLPFMFCSCEDEVSDQQGESGEEMKKLIKELVYQEDEDSDWKEVYSFVYDSVGRLKKVIIIYEGKEVDEVDEEMIYEYNDGVLLVKFAENDPDPVLVYFEDEGLVTSLNDKYSKSYFTYDDNSCLQTLIYVSKSTGYERTTSYIWKGGNVAAEVTTDNSSNSSKCTYTYYDIADKLNIDVFSLFESGVMGLDFETIDKSVFRGIYNRNLLKRIEELDESGRPRYIHSFSYEFDSDGYPTKISILEWGATISIKY